MKEDDREGYGIGDRFHRETKYAAGTMGGHSLDWENMPAPFKDYPTSLATVALPEPAIPRPENVWKVFMKRRSIRTYSRAQVLPFGLLSSMLWATQGITADQGEWSFRTVPSAGGLYPIETYVFARAVEVLEEGIYHFRPHAFDLELIRRGDFSLALANAALGQTMIGDAQATFVWTAVVARSKWKYRQRAYRYIYMDAGHIAQNLYLAGCAAGLGVCAVGAFFDDEVNELIGIDGKEEVTVYLACVGMPEGT
ncbi:MAG TPA: SagB/ThcOx family dehydrogenase [Syntrophorhabdales bacterium]|nr:SagB/ThcOx family dehydrogenase [Syntrophorhabdales bacterium]